MIVYQKTYAEFTRDIITNVIVDEVVSHLPFHVGPAEQQSFQNSLPAVQRALMNCSIPDDADVALEYRIPLTNRRIDFLIAGSDDAGQDHVVICELKQWSSVIHTDMPDIVLERGIEKVHPSWQAYSYGATISGFNEYVEQSGLIIDTCTFLHNYLPEDLPELIHPNYEEGILKAPPFIKTQFPDFAEFVSKRIRRKSETNLFEKLDNGRLRPSKTLALCLGNLLNGNDEYNLIDNQRIVYSNLFREINESFKDPSRGKHVFIVRGGAGTGKSVIAIQLMTNLIKDKGRSALYVAKSAYVKKAYFQKLTKDVPRHSYLRTLFRGSSSFIGEEQDRYDVLVVDEAHRLTEKSKQSWMYKGENQVREIIHAGKTVVFFIDETQNIDIKDFGSIHSIKEAAEAEGAIVHCDDKYVLTSQFRCKGSDEYLAWLDAVLYNREYRPSGQEFTYDIRVCDDLCRIKEEIAEHNSNSNIPSRMLSGDVFDWRSRTEKSAIDIEIGDFRAQWNLSESFATDPKSIDEVGCIHTSQGMEFEYVGLIVGDDLIYRDGKVTTDYTKHPEHAGEFKRPHQRKVLPEDSEIVDRLIRNTYKVLMTRGQKGCILYVMDPELRGYLRRSVDELKSGRVA